MRQTTSISKDEYIHIRTQNLLDNFSTNKNFIKMIIQDYFFNDVINLSNKEFKNLLITNSSYLEEHLEKEE